MPGLVPGIHVLLALTFEDVDGRDEPGHDAFLYVARIPVLRGSISSGRGPLSRLCMWTMKAMPNKGVARLTIGIETNAAITRPAVKMVAALSLRIALASAGGRNRIAANSKYSRPSSHAVAM